MENTDHACFPTQINTSDCIRKCVIVTPIFLAVMILVVWPLLFHLIMSSPSEIKFDSASFSKLNSTNTNLTATWFVSLRFKNSRPPPFLIFFTYSISYSRLQATIIYEVDDNHERELAISPTTPSFHQGPGDIANFGFGFELANEYVGEEVVKGLADAWGRGYVDFEVRLKAKYKCKGLCYFSSRMKVDCGPIRFGLLSHNGTGLFAGLVYGTGRHEGKDADQCR